jgi:altronate hydrolase
MSATSVKIHPADNVIVALTDLPAGAKVMDNGREFTILQPVPAKHKFVIDKLQAGQEIIMYGVTVGTAKTTIRSGEAVGVHNATHKASGYGRKTRQQIWSPPDVSKWKGRTFMGYHRADGQVGTANYWVVIPLVFCESRNVQMIREAFEEELGFAKSTPYKKMVRELVSNFVSGKPLNEVQVDTRDANATVTRHIFRNVDGIKFLDHEGGCGGTRQDADALCALLAGYIHNPNVAGATVLSLGCQNAQVEILEKHLQAFNANFNKPLLVFEQQKEGTEQQLLSKAIHQTFLGMVEANKLERKPAPLSKLVIGLECGGSDGFSGISANPAIGHTSDLLVALGGTTILSEFPELCGVEQELIDRCVDDRVANRFSELMRLYSNAAEAVGSGFDMNPSPGNIKDGLITDAMKSAGAAKKGGTSPVTDVLDYGEYVKTAGLNLLCTPGNDVESTTAEAGAGANIVLFTTGLGTPTGNPVTPVIKLSTNTKLAQRMPDIIDIDTGSVITGQKTIEEMGEEILEFVIDVASGLKKPKAVHLEQNDFIPWKRGVSL